MSSHCYPRKGSLQGPGPTEVKHVRRALDDGLDPNILWSEETMVDPPKGGCVMPRAVRDEDTWPHYNTPLHRALRFADFESAELLLERHADINMYNSVGYTPLNEAVWNKKHDTIRFLLAHGADANKPTVSACVRWEYRNRDIKGNAGGINIQTSLRNSDDTTLCMLLETGVDLCPDSQQPWSLLDLALLASDRKAIEILLSRGFQLPRKTAGHKVDSTKDCDQSSAKQLLATAMSTVLVPPPDLYDSAYCLTLWQMDGSITTIGHDTTLLDIEALVRGFFNLIEAKANVPPNPSTNLCTSCRDLQSKLACKYVNKTKLKFQLHDTREELALCALTGCLLCGITADALDFATKKYEPKNVEEQREKVTDPQPVVLTYSHNMYVSCGKLTNMLNISYVDDPWQSHCNVTDSGTDSDQAMRLAKEWLHECGNGATHAACQEAYQKLERSDTWPRRLLHIEEPSGKLRVVERLKQEPYFALSYCWGLAPFTTTRRQNLSQHSENIPLDELPPVMQDAISVTRALGYQYLWIDALCIVQDDREDWAREAAGMHVVYSQAELTISSLASSNCYDGLFEPRGMRITRPVIFNTSAKRHRSGTGSQVIIPEWAQKNARLHGPVHSRAWTLQEQLLSTRILFFGNGTLHWECLHGYYVEADPGGNLRYSYQYRNDLERWIDAKLFVRNIISNDSMWQQQTSRGLDLSHGFDAFEHWKSQLEEFTHRQITYFSDRLPAFASIGAGLATAGGNESVCGVWKGDRILESLCWRVVSRGTKVTTAMPSWTWAAVSGEISFDLVSLASRGRAAVTPHARVISIDDGLSSDRDGPSLTIKGTLCSKMPVEPSFFHREEHFATRYVVHKKDPRKGPVYLDYLFDGTEQLFTMDVLSFPKGPQHKGRGIGRWSNGRLGGIVRMILRKEESGSNRFARVGIGSVCDLRSKTSEEEKEPETRGQWLRFNKEVHEDVEIVVV